MLRCLPLQTDGRGMQRGWRGTPSGLRLPYVATLGCNPPRDGTATPSSAPSAAAAAAGASSATNAYRPVAASDAESDLDGAEAARADIGYHQHQHDRQHQHEQINLLAHLHD